MSRDLGSVTLLGVESIGRPGQRQFRLFTQSREGSALLWIEKEQLDGLAVAIDRALALITEGHVLRTEAQAGESEQPEGIPPQFPRHPTYDLHVGQMQLSYNEIQNVFSLHVVPVEAILEQGRESQISEEDILTLTFTPEQAQYLARNIVRVIAGGRPVCPLCHTPLDGGPHACIKQNGHHEVVQIETSDDESENG